MRTKSPRPVVLKGDKRQRWTSDGESPCGASEVDVITPFRAGSQRETRCASSVKRCVNLARHTEHKAGSDALIGKTGGGRGSGAHGGTTALAEKETALHPATASCTLLQKSEVPTGRRAALGEGDLL